MIYVMRTCSVAIGKRKEFEDVAKEAMTVYEKHGAKLIGFWWVLGGEGNEAVWIYSWKDLKHFDEEHNVLEGEDYPIEKFASTVITYTDKILKPSPISLK